MVKKNMKLKRPHLIFQSISWIYKQYLSVEKKYMFCFISEMTNKVLLFIQL